jgi:hypothetical protein
MPSPAKSSGELDHATRQLERAAGLLDPGPPAADVAIDQDSDLRAIGRGGGEALDGDRRIGRHLETNLPREPGRALPLRLADEGVRDQDVVEPRRRHHFGLAELLTGDPHRPGSQLPVGDKGQLVGLYVRPEAESSRIREGLLPRDVAVDRNEIDADHGGVDVLAH